MDGYRYILRQVSRQGELWVSPECFYAPTLQHVRQAVVAGYLHGEPRWAETVDSGMFLYGIDARGKSHETGTCCEDFSVPMLPCRL